MLKRIMVLAVAGLMSFGATAAVYGQAAPQPPQQREVPQATLTAEKVEAFISSYDDLGAMTKRFEQENTAALQPGQPPSAAMMQRFQQQKAEIDAAAAKHGFADFNEWSTVAYSVGMAVAFAEGEGTSGPIKQIEAQRAEIVKNPRIPAQQKQQMQQMIDQQIAYLKSVEPLPGNVEAVKPYIDMLKGLKESDR